jgi:hypothetical protein
VTPDDFKPLPYRCQIAGNRKPAPGGLHLTVTAEPALHIALTLIAPSEAHNDPAARLSADGTLDYRWTPADPGHFLDRLSATLASATQETPPTQPARVPGLLTRGTPPGPATPMDLLVGVQRHGDQHLVTLGNAPEDVPVAMLDARTTQQIADYLDQATTGPA